MKLAVVGHVEWADVLHVETLPHPGEWQESLSHLSEPAGAGATAARQLAALGAETSFFTALTDHPLSQRARGWCAEREIDVHARTEAGEPQRRAFVVVDAQAERTILISGPKLCPRAADDLPWSRLDAYAGACFVCGDAGAVVEARRANVLVATARWLPALREAGVELDALVESASDPDERFTLGELDPPPRMVVTTAGADGGSFTVRGEPERSFSPAPTPGPAVDSYGAGDSFLAGLTFGLARGDRPADAIALAARCGAAVVGSKGLSGQLDAAGLQDG